MKPPVLIDVPLPSYIDELITPLCEPHAWEEAFDEHSGPPLCERIEGLYVYAHPILDGPFLDRFPRLKVISNFGVGMDHCDLDAVAERSIVAGNTPGAVDGATADLAMAILLAAARNVVVGDHFARSKEFTHFDPSLLLGKEVHGSTLGIFGMGRVGQAIAKRALGFDMKVLYHNRRQRPNDEATLGVEYVTREELLSRSDFVCLSLPLSPETHHYIGDSEFDLMGKDAILVNVARGPVVDHDALYTALVEKKIRCAAIDVTEPEPLPRDHRLLSLENLVITPHLGSAAYRSRRRMGEMTAANLKAGLDGAELPWPARP